MAFLTGIGLATPPHSISRQSGAAMAKTLSCVEPDQHRTIDALYRRTRIDSRGSVLFGDQGNPEELREFYPPITAAGDGPTTECRSNRYAAEAPQLASSAAAEALDRAGCRGRQVTHLVVVSCTGFSAPGVDVALIKRLGLPRTTQRIVVGFMGCHAAVNGLRAATAIADSDASAVVLVVSVELCSLHYQYGFDPDRIVSGALFADGAAGVVVRGDRDAGSGDPAMRWIGSGSCLIDDSESEMTWRICNHGYEMTLSSRVPTLIEEQLPTYLSEFLGRHELTPADIGGWAVHPGGPRILSAVQTCMNLSDDQLATSHEVLKNHGNMSSATMLFIVQRFWQRGQAGPWLMLGFGPGLEIEVGLIGVDGR